MKDPRIPSPWMGEGDYKKTTPLPSIPSRQGRGNRFFIIYE
jgi:hypothetical protein